MSLTVPESFAGQFDDEAGEWLAGLPALTESCLARWDLTVDGPLMHGVCALVVPVRRPSGEPAVLKVTWPHDEARHEALALSLWDGDGAVRLLAHDDDAWALLLERLDPATTLRNVPIDEALAVVTGLITRLDRPAPPGVRHLRDNAARWVRELPAENDGRVPAGLVEQAVAYCRELTPGNHLVNEDLHYDNVLRGEREPWLVIDPKPIAGDREFGLVPLLWNRFDDVQAAGGLAAIADAAGLDRELARKWTFVRAVDNWLDSGEDHWLGAACARIAAATA
ncbi:aminoglycoside phosphotransferase family protein [Actinophytocola algeriensis]|uniref:Streptomycin 6-kinase n=1 Tax=Actinophytocola algeriensis TaxID=1768010 RepID=A0A7W7VIY4_9PSEU|nr:aminoglycoside phosphotransferase family protein [Actinophytocola algeriensis]MBB4912001.1 streptomycin 6-kinase [Actinophytocola algeriensis]MBE1477507.1 streptomycin 6-kinase [Actinophytocola algeriensis]